MIRPAGMVPMVTSKKTIGFFGFGGLKCHSTLPPPDAIEALKSLALSLALSQSGVCVLMKVLGVYVSERVLR